MMHDREKMTMLFNAALQESEPSATGQAILPAADPYQQHQQYQQEFARQQAYEAQRQAYLAQQQAYEQQQAYLAQQQAYARQAAYEQQQALARQQAYEQQQAYERQQACALQQAYEEQQARARQEMFAREQELARQQFYARQLAYDQPIVGTPMTDDEDPGDLVSAASIQHAVTREPETSAPPEEPASSFAAPAPSAFVFRKPGETEEDASNAAMRSSSDEFAVIMDEKMAKARKKHSRSFVFTMILFFGPTLGGAGWFVSEPTRVYALRDTISEIRSAGDIHAIIAKYQKSLDKVAVRGQHIDEATSMMGIDPKSVSPDEDPFFDKEMQDMTGADGGPTVAQRNKRLQEKFADVKNSKGIGAKFAKKADGAEEAKAAK